jgi:S1-C subfamily serine protease
MFEGTLAEFAGERGEQYMRDFPSPSSRAQAPTPSKESGNKISMGSGFFVTTDGHALTNAHVVDGCEKITMRTVDGTKTSASILARNQTDDLALLKTATPVPSIAPLRVSPPPRTGEAIVVYGFPLSGLLTSAGNATTGNECARRAPKRCEAITDFRTNSAGQQRRTALDMDSCEGVNRQEFP